MTVQQGNYSGIKDSICDAVGFTPMVRLARIGRDLPGELDHLNLDPRQTLYLALASLAGATRERLAG